MHVFKNQMQVSLQSLFAFCIEINLHQRSNMPLFLNLSGNRSTVINIYLVSNSCSKFQLLSINSPAMFLAVTLLST